MKSKQLVISNKEKARVAVMLAVLALGILAVALWDNNKNNNKSAQENSQGSPLAPSLSVEQAPAVEDRVVRVGALGLAPQSGAGLVVGKQEKVDITIDTEGQRVLVVEAFLHYNPEEVEVVSLESTGSPFSLEVLPDKEALAERGTVHIIRGILKQPPEEAGFSGAGILATLVVKPLKKGSASISIDENTSAYVYLNSNAKSAFRTVGGVSVEVQ